MTRIDQAHLDIAAATHPGMIGKQNEDRYNVSAFLTGTEKNTPAVLAVLCDGIGGHRAGEVAAQMGVDLIARGVAASDGQQPIKTLEKAIQKASHAIYKASLSEQGCIGMGATCACAWVIGNRLFTANLGDSRIYLLRGGHILQLTTDHTWLQEAYDAGIIDEEGADEHPNAHVIRRYLGSSKAPRPDFRLWFFEGESDADALDNQGLLLEPGDVLLLCSDGLTDLVTDEEIQALVISSPLSAVPAALIDLANTRGGHDNTTVVLLGMPFGSTEKSGASTRRRRLMGCLVGLIILVLLAAAVYVGLRWRADRLDAQATTQPTITQPLPAQPTETPPAELTATPPEVTHTPEVEEVVTTPLPTITPWPTHTPAP